MTTAESRRVLEHSAGLFEDYLVVRDCIEEVLVGAAVVSAAICLVLSMTLGGFLG